jgi:hypothetical protein
MTMAAISSPELGYSPRRGSGAMKGTTSIEIHSPSYHAFRLLQLAFVVVPIVAGLDKFFDVLTNWDRYLASPLEHLSTVVGGPHHLMQIAGVIEICAGLLVAFRPRVFAWVVAAWLFAIIVDLLMLGGAGDVALRDFGLMLGAVALARLGERYDGAIQRPRYVEREMAPDSRDLVKP